MHRFNLSLSMCAIRYLGSIKVEEGIIEVGVVNFLDLEDFHVVPFEQSKSLKLHEVVEGCIAGLHVGEPVVPEGGLLLAGTGRP